MSADVGPIPEPILVTGATGVVGAPLLAALRSAGLDTTGCSARGADDVVPWRMGAEPAPVALRRPWGTIVNAAADTRWNLTAAAARAANVASTEALAEVAAPGTHIVHVSTAYAIGRLGDVRSADPADYCNTYEWSKAEAERLVRARHERVSIVRAPLLVGDRHDGAVARFSGLYTLLQGVARGFVPALVGYSDAPLEIASTDDIVRCLCRVAAGPPSAEAHVLGVDLGAPTLQQVTDGSLASLNRWREAQGIAPLAMPPVLEPERWDRFFLPFARQHFSPTQLRMVELVSEFRPYLDGSRSITPTERCASILPDLDVCVRYWAEHNASSRRTPREWTIRGSSAGDASPRVEPDPVSSTVERT